MLRLNDAAMQLSQDLRTQNLQPHVENNSYFSFFSELSHSHWSVTTVETLVQMAIFLISVITNIGAFSLVVHERRRTDSTLFTLNLFVADLLFISTIPFIIAVRWTEAWTLGPVACHAVMYSICLSGSVTITTLAAISTDRLLAILKMESTPSLNLRRASGVLLLIWLFTAVAVLPLSLFSRVVTVVSFEQREMQICTLAWPHVRGEIIWNTTFVVLGYLLPGIGIVFSYGKILQVNQNRILFPGAIELTVSASNICSHHRLIKQPFLLPEILYNYPGKQSKEQLITSVSSFIHR
uniref:Free fatty acid receptor 4 n=1 Tax=Astyanax mexicanus TaxID=7994 RepID=A0A8B9GSM5_ASTMX